jgi:phage gp36-like protein
MSYTTVAKVRTSLGDLSASAISATVIQDGIDDADGLIDAYIGAKYTTPLTTVAPMIKRISRDIATYHVFNDQIAGGSAPEAITVVEARYDRAMKLLKEIRDGKLQVPLASSLGDSSMAVWGNTDGHKQAFDLDDELNWGIDGNLLEEIEDERDAADTVLPEEG